MDNWLFALVVLAFGVVLALLVDRLKRVPGPLHLGKDRRKWLYFWFLGRFPTVEEIREEEEEEKRAEDEKKRR